jgi:hypothetical protein
MYPFAAATSVRTICASLMNAPAALAEIAVVPPQLNGRGGVPGVTTLADLGELRTRLAAL